MPALRDNIKTKLVKQVVKIVLVVMCLVQINKVVQDVLLGSIQNQDLQLAKTVVQVKQVLQMQTLAHCALLEKNVLVVELLL